MKLTRLEIFYGGNIDEREKNGQIMRESSYITEYNKIAPALNIPYYPNLSVGWDDNVRFYNFRPGVVVNNTPENFKNACEEIKRLADEGMEKGVLKAPFITVNSWNEWTETSYLQPDDLYGYSYLEAIKEVFTEE